MNFQEFKEKVSTKIEINLNSYKEKRVHRRTNNFIKKHNLKNYEESLKKISTDAKLRRQFLEHMTINTTEFFRNKKNYNYLQENILPRLFSQHRKVKIWSAASSIGCEAYTIAIILNELNIDSSRYEILATDIDPEALKQAKKGEYKENTLKKTDPAIINKYFTKQNNNRERYKIKPELKELVKFDILNLLKDKYYTNVNLLLCRNVFIYFTKEIKKNLTIKLTKALAPKGILFLGNTEYLLHPGEYDLKKLHTSFYEKKEN